MKLLLLSIVALSLARAQSQQEKQIAEKLHLLISNGTTRLVKDKPYTAEGITEVTQILADGNRILRHNSTRYFRDRAGRTRREQTIEALGPSSPIATVQLIVISDPVAAIDYILDPIHKTARKFSRAPREGPSPEESGNLGKRVIQGLACIGTKKVTTIAAGEIGNERPIEVVTETWYAPAIEALVYSTTSDPRFCQTTYTLRNIILADPPPGTFDLPPGYKVD